MRLREHEGPFALLTITPAGFHVRVDCLQQGHLEKSTLKDVLNAYKLKLNAVLLLLPLLVAMESFSPKNRPVRIQVHG